MREAVLYAEAGLQVKLICQETYMRVADGRFGLNVFLLMILWLALPTGRGWTQEVPIKSTLYTAVDIPANFDYPAASQDLLGYVYSGDDVAIRQHAWTLWAGLTEPSGSMTPDGQSLPIWETWYSATEVFDDRYAQGNPTLATRPVRHQLEIPRQSQYHKNAIDGHPAAIMSFVKFNPTAAHHIWDNDLYLQSTLATLQTHFDVNGTPTEERQIKPFPREAIALKAVFWLIKQPSSVQTQQGLTAVPFWDPAYLPPPDGQTPTHLTWRRCVAVDPTNQRSGQTLSITCNGTPGVMAEVVGLDRFYSYRLGSTNDVVDAQHFMKILSSIGHEQERFITDLNQIPELGDYVALVAMHVTTKEIDNWTFQSFWWSPLPDAAPYGVDRSSRVTGVWRNYVMCTAYSMVTPRLSDGSPHRCFNPYLETDLGPVAAYRVGNTLYPPDPMAGTRANCMNCHMRAAWGASQPINPANSGFIAANDLSLSKQTKLDFLWSLLFHSQPRGSVWKGRESP